MTDIIIRYVAGYGYLPIIEINGVEAYRGEFKQSPGEALDACILFMNSD